MKKILGAVAASLLLAGTASAAPTGTQTVIGSVGAAVDIIVTATSALGPLSAPANSYGTTLLTVNSTDAYTVSVKSTQATMTQWDGSAYVAGVDLNDPLTAVAVASTDVGSTTTAIGTPSAARAISTTDQVLFTGTQAESAAKIEVDYTQPVDWGTPAGDYQIDLTYTIAVSAI